MYIVIVCVNCNGSSQVDEAMLGKVVGCPLCGKATVARTQTAVLPVAKPIEQPAPASLSAQETPLSLDDATPLPSPEKPKVEYRPVLPPKKPPAPPIKRSPVRTAVWATLSLLVTIVLMTGIYAAFRYGNGLISDSAWKTFRPPDGKCSVLMPGDPIEEEIPGSGSGELGGKRFTVKLWFERVEVSCGWMDYDAIRIEKQGFEHIALPLRDREMTRMNGKLIGESKVNYSMKDRKIEARLVTIDLEKGKAFLQMYFDADFDRYKTQIRTEMIPKETLIFVPLAGVGGLWAPIKWTEQYRTAGFEPGQRIRLWFVSAQGRKINKDTPWISKFLTSFAPE